MGTRCHYNTQSTVLSYDNMEWAGMTCDVCASFFGYGFVSNILAF